MTTEPRYLVCPSCEHRKRVTSEGDSRPKESGEIRPTDGETVCPECGSGRAYRAAEPTLPDAETETYVKFDAESAGGER